MDENQEIIFQEIRKKVNGLSADIDILSACSYYKGRLRASETAKMYLQEVVESLRADIEEVQELIEVFLRLLEE